MPMSNRHRTVRPRLGWTPTVIRRRTIEGDGNMAQFVLLLHERTIDFEDMSPEQIQNLIQEYGAWSQSMAEAGNLLGGHKLKDGEGRRLAGWQSDFSVTDGPHTEAKEVIGGFFHIEASDYDAAVALSESCPHLKYGGTIEVRQIDLVEE
jgi:hypothetical protein